VQIEDTDLRLRTKRSYRRGWQSLQAAVAVIKGGGAPDRGKGRERPGDDALHAPRAAGEEGIVPAAAWRFLRAAKALDKLKPVNEDQQAGHQNHPQGHFLAARLIDANAGEDGAVVVRQDSRNANIRFGYNASTGEVQ